MGHSRTVAHAAAGVLVLAALVLVATQLMAVIAGGGGGAGDGHGPTSAPSPSAVALPTPCPGPWGCAQQRRFDAAVELLARQAGRIGIVVRDRRTGARWRAGEPGARIWAGSTPKLALAVALREEARAGRVSLDAVATRQIDAMLSASDNTAADALWDRYGNAAALMSRFRQLYGMAAAGYVPGFPSRWGFVKCTAEDLTNLMSYVLDTLHPADSEYIVEAMRTVDPVQRWGVWGAGPALRPGVKNGWSIERDGGHRHWITATVGFAGPDERYVVAAMFDQPPGGDSIERGVHVLTDLVATVFGVPVPAPAVVPTDD